MLETTIGGARTANVAYSLEDIALVPSRRTREASTVDVSWQLDAYNFDLPVIGGPQDSVTSPTTAGILTRLGALSILSLEGLWTRYADPEDVLAEISQLTPGPAATQRLQQLYSEPIKEDLIGSRVEQLKSEHGFAAGSLSPQKVERWHRVALEAGLDMLLIHGLAVTAQHTGAPESTTLDLRSFTARYDIPVLIGGVAAARTAIHLMRTGAVGVLVGNDASGTITSHAALGIEVPMATAIAEVAAARSRYLEESGRYVQVIAAGGIRTGGDVAKAIACGADAVMLGRALASATEAPAGGAYWGISSGHQELPRGRFLQVEPLGTIEEILNGPAHRDDGQVNLVGGLRRAMGLTGYESRSRFHEVELTLRSRQL